jgi:hypothetical protein
VARIHIGTYEFPLDSFYVDEAALSATITRVSIVACFKLCPHLTTGTQDGAREALRITFPSITSVEYGGDGGDVTLALCNPPILAAVSLTFPGRTPSALFRVDGADAVERFRKAMAARVPVCLFLSMECTC